jgi:toxin-antitoxin system PIN domain toxin
MILPDINVLIYAHNRADKRFKLANRWLTEILNGPSQVGFCWETLNGFVRISTNPRLDAPISLRQGLSIIRAWLDTPNAVIVGQSARHLDVIEEVATGSNAHGPLYSDAVLAAIAIEHNAVLATTDRDFRRFKGLKVLDPLTQDA